MARARLYREGHMTWASRGEKDSDERGMERAYFRRGTACKSGGLRGLGGDLLSHGVAERRKVKKAERIRQ